MVVRPTWVETGLPCAFGRVTRHQHSSKTATYGHAGQQDRRGSLALRRERQQTPTECLLGAQNCSCSAPLNPHHALHCRDALGRQRHHRDSSSRSPPDLSLDSHLPGPRPLPRETETHSLHLLVRMFTEGMHGIVECLAQRRKQSRRSGKHSWVIWRHRRWPGVSVHHEDRPTLLQQPCLFGAENEQMKGQDPWAPVLPLSR